ncbi:hypothetical protein D3C76_831150 [compost metagenome]
MPHNRIKACMIKILFLVMTKQKLDKKLTGIIFNIPVQLQIRIQDPLFEISSTTSKGIIDWMMRRIRIGQSIIMLKSTAIILIRIQQ